jgi:hypothetical protein
MKKGIIAVITAVIALSTTGTFAASITTLKSKNPNTPAPVEAPAVVEAPAKVDKPVSTVNASTAPRYECFGTLYQLSEQEIKRGRVSKGNHASGMVSSGSITLESFRKKLITYKFDTEKFEYGKGKYECTNKDEKITGVITFADGDVKRVETTEIGNKIKNIDISSLDGSNPDE